MSEAPQDLQIDALLADYKSQRCSPSTVIAQRQRAASLAAERNIWISLASTDTLREQLAELEARRIRGEALPLFGIPFGVKDNIDVKGYPTTAACPSFERRPAASAHVVEKLQTAGAIVLGKTNLDQFATGLVGTRSPYGACSSAFDPLYISGGSSSGSALAVALGHVSFALGTDTAGSGRVPAAFNNIVGLKPTRGILSTRGVLPACRSLDCVSIFAGNAADCWSVLQAAVGYDAEEPYSRAMAPNGGALPRPFRFGVPSAPEFCGDRGSERAFASAIEHLTALGGQAVAIDFTPFQQTAALLYVGPWVAERAAAVGDFIATEPAGLDPTVRAIIRGGNDWSALQTFEAQYRLQALRQTVSLVWQDIDVLLVPTAPTTFSHEQITADPIGHNSKLGTYTNFTNLLDLAGMAVPAGFKEDGKPFGVTLLGPAFCDAPIAALAAELHESYTLKVGATAHAVRPRTARVPFSVLPDASAPRARAPQSIKVAVVGAHLKGQPLHGQLLRLGAQFLGARQTSSGYRLFALRNTQPAKPGLVRSAAGGVAIEVEVYALDRESFGHFVAEVAAPLAIGNVELDSGEWVKGFVVEPIATEGAAEISAHGGWRAYLNSLAQ